jgi:hypothetical protein
MELQNSVIEYYLNELTKGTDAATVIELAINDPQLLVFTELMDHCQVSKVNSVWVDRMRLLAYGTVNSIIENLRPDWVSEIIFSKLQTLSVLSFVGDIGWSGIKIDTLKEFVQCKSRLELFRLLLNMHKRGILDILIDERAGTIDVINMHVFRDVDPTTVSLVLEKLEKYMENVRSIANDGSSVMSADTQRLMGIMGYSDDKEAKVLSTTMSVSPQIFKRGRNT